MPLSTDEDYVRASLANKEQFAELIARYEAKLLRYLERLGLTSREDREDVLQNAFIKAYRNLNSFDSSLSFSSWMYRIAHNEAMSFFRQRRARPTLLFGDAKAVERMLGELKDELADPTEAAEARLTKERVGRALSLLPGKYRNVLALRYFEDRSYAEISDILQLPVGTISTLIHRAKTTLRTIIEKDSV